MTEGTTASPDPSQQVLRVGPGQRVRLAPLESHGAELHSLREQLFLTARIQDTEWRPSDSREKPRRYLQLHPPAPALFHKQP